MEELLSKVLCGIKSERKEIPKYIKNILELNGLDTIDTLATIDEKVIGELENFARTTMVSVIEEGENLKDYFNIFDKCPEKFLFVVGHKKLLNDIAVFAKESVNECKKTEGKGRAEKNSEKKNPVPSSENSTSNLNEVTDSLYTSIKRQLSKMSIEEDIRIKNSIKETSSTSSAPNIDQNTTKSNGYATVSIICVLINLCGLSEGLSNVILPRILLYHGLLAISIKCGLKSNHLNNRKHQGRTGSILVKLGRSLNEKKNVYLNLISEI